MKEYRTEHLSDEQIADLLSTALEPTGRQGEVLAEFQRFAGMPSTELVQTVRKELSARGLTISETAELLGVRELTVKRWFNSSKELEESVKRQLAGLCVLLLLAADDVKASDSVDLVRSAAFALRSDVGQDADAARAESVDILTSVFDVAGLTAANLRSALQAD